MKIVKENIEFKRTGDTKSSLKLGYENNPDLLEKFYIENLKKISFFRNVQVWKHGRTKNQQLEIYCYYEYGESNPGHNERIISIFIYKNSPKYRLRFSPQKYFTTNDYVEILEKLFDFLIEEEKEKSDFHIKRIEEINNIKNI